MLTRTTPPIGGSKRSAIKGSHGRESKTGSVSVKLLVMLKRSTYFNFCDVEKINAF